MTPWFPEGPRGLRIARIVKYTAIGAAVYVGFLSPLPYWAQLLGLVVCSVPAVVANRRILADTRGREADGPSPDATGSSAATPGGSDRRDPAGSERENPNDTENPNS